MIQGIIDIVYDAWLAPPILYLHVVIHVGLSRPRLTTKLLQVSLSDRLIFQ